MNKEEVDKYLKSAKERIAYFNQCDFDKQSAANAGMPSVVGAGDLLQALVETASKSFSVNCDGWWLRDNPNNYGYVLYIDSKGDIKFAGVAEYYGIRPAMWISL